MLKQRLITAVILIPLVVLGILLLSTSILQWILAGVTLIAAWEWFSLIGFNNFKKRMIPFLALIVILLGLRVLTLDSLSMIALVAWAVILLFVVLFSHKELSGKSRALFANPLSAFVLSSLVLALFWYSAVLLHQSSQLGPQQLLYIMVLVWLADTGGYFAGKRWGNTALATAISPNKTWEGVAGAFVLGDVWAVLAFYLGIAGTLSLSIWLLLSAVALFLSIIGDLFESLFKRCHNVKDSGNLLPGHGGMLDRIDSLIAAVPVFTAGYYFLGA